MSLGQKIGRLRQERGLTLQEVSDGSGLTPSFLSRLERDKVNISVANLRKLAQFFSVQMTHFFEGEDSQQAGQVLTVADRVRLSLDDAPVQVYALLPPNSDLEARLLEARPGSGQQGFSGRGSQMVLVLQGQLRYTLGDEEYTLNTGDTLFYRDDMAHSWINSGETLAVVLTVSALAGREER
ncbi:helix-turn-helix domain-containing protein [Oscillochloris trichoides DG-6]|uniref:Helix-turn-helix domain-containing protein n=1 Tax=Oscillochloris trichoides DG-6 TaxID=765420 RepID=E1IH72_9CHLR|nr:XRE family transcriptional regulator [Oscillochloris trichoides]EFO79547.1 helix-turn-helix domain-containing protein [Oscillochloris trichoides DG-6]